MIAVLAEQAERDAFVASVRRFVASEDPAGATRNGEDTDAVRRFCRTVAELGWTGVALPEKYGGQGGTVTEACLLLDELAYGRAPVSGIVTSMVAANTFLHFGTEDQKREVLGAICRGRVCAIGMSEPDAGSDLASLRCRAERSAETYTINGQKTWTSAAHYASRILLLCRTARAANKHDGITMLDVATDLPGLTTAQIDTLGGRDVCDVFLTDVEVPADRVIGTPGNGWPQLLDGLAFERTIGSAALLGHARRILDDALEYVRQRHQFGRPIADFQAIRHRLADIATEIECCRLLVYETAAAAHADPVRASMAKLKTSETVKRAAIEGMQMTGGMGYTSEFGMAAHLRHAMVATIYGGTSEIQRDIIAQQLTRPRSG